MTTESKIDEWNEAMEIADLTPQDTQKLGHSFVRIAGILTILITSLDCDALESPVESPVECASVVKSTFTGFLFKQYHDDYRCFCFIIVYGQDVHSLTTTRKEW
jgi:hypothetical protein